MSSSSFFAASSASVLRYAPREKSHVLRCALVAARRVHSHKSLRDYLVFPRRLLAQPAHLELERLVFRLVVQGVDAAWSRWERVRSSRKWERDGAQKIAGAHFRDLFQGLPTSHLVELELFDLRLCGLPSLAERAAKISLRTRTVCSDARSGGGGEGAHARRRGPTAQSCAADASSAPARQRRLSSASDVEQGFHADGPRHTMRECTPSRTGEAIREA